MTVKFCNKTCVVSFAYLGDTLKVINYYSKASAVGLAKAKLFEEVLRTSVHIHQKKVPWKKNK